MNCVAVQRSAKWDKHITLHQNPKLAKSRKWCIKCKECGVGRLQRGGMCFLTVRSILGCMCVGVGGMKKSYRREPFPRGDISSRVLNFKAKYLTMMMIQDQNEVCIKLCDNTGAPYPSAIT